MPPSPTLKKVPSSVAARARALWAFSEMEPKDMAENMIGTSSFSCGGRGSTTRRSRSFILRISGRLPKNTRVSMGSRKGSMEGLVTWLAFSSRWSQ